MNVLLAGNEPQERVELLLKLTKISEQHSKALKLHLVNGATEEYAAGVYSVNKSNLNRSLKALNETAKIVERIKELDWVHLQNPLKVVG